MAKRVGIVGSTSLTHWWNRHLPHSEEGSMTEGRKPGQTPENAEKFALYAEWLFSAPEDRKFAMQKDICKHLGVSQQTAVKWKHQLERQRGFSDDDLKEWLDNTKRIAYEKGNSKALELLGKARGFFTEKRQESKVIVELTADDYYKIRSEAIKRMEGLYREQRPVGDGIKESGVLSTGVHVSPDEGQAIEDGTVGALALPD